MAQPRGEFTPELELTPFVVHGLCKFSGYGEDPPDCGPVER